MLPGGEEALPPKIDILYGTAWKQDDTERLVKRALEAGFRGIDTACQPKHYNEQAVGAGIAASLTPRLKRAQLYLQTKFTPLSGQEPLTVPYDARASLSEQVAQSAALSLKNLRTDYLDCLLLHSPLPDLHETFEVWHAMEQLVDSGIARQLGISNLTRLAQLQAVCEQARIPPAVLQNRFHAESGYDRQLREFCRERDIVYQSFWTLTANPQLLAHQTVHALARTHGRTPAQILFRYLTQLGIVPLTGTRSAAHMRQDLAIFDFELSADECQSMDALLYPPAGQDRRTQPR
jgi:diketogulonate reductase-like aldo/keto reductase